MGVMYVCGGEEGKGGREGNFDRSTFKIFIASSKGIWRSYESLGFLSKLG